MNTIRLSRVIGTKKEKEEEGEKGGGQDCAIIHN